MRKMIFTLVLVIASSVWMTSEASWCMSVAKAGNEQNIRIGGTFQAESMPCEDDPLPCPPCLTIALQSGGIHYLVSNAPQIVTLLDTVPIGSFAIIEGNHYHEGHVDFINVTNIIFPQTDIQQLSGEWEISRETVSTPTGDGGTRWFSTHDVNYTNYVLADDLIYKVILDQSSGYAHYSDAVPYTVERKEDGTWLLTAEGMFSSSDPVEEGIASPITIYRLTEDEMEWMYAANGGDEGPDYYYQHLKRHTQKETKLPSLCDEWNILEVSNVTCGGCEEYRTYHSQLTKDTIINGKVYAQLIEDGAYRAALREGDKRDIYCIPSGSTHEYLLYDFDVQAGDQLENLWLGGMPEDYPNGWMMTVEERQEGTPRTYVLSTGYTQPEEGLEVYPLYCTWIEGVGLSDGPVGVKRCVGCADSRGYGVLCAYKNGEQVYVSDMGEQHGCVYNYDPYAPVETIPLFARDDSGSSTVDPVDPNQVVASLKGNELIIHEFMGVEITYMLRHKEPVKTPSSHRAPQSDTFRDEVTIPITESGEYLLELTNPSWGYTIFGEFDYLPQGIETVHSNTSQHKVLLNGRLYIHHGDHIYDTQGKMIQ